MLEISNLKAGYNGKAVLTIPSLTLADGEHGLILGKSGSGKTTLLYAVAGLLQPLSGSIRLNNTDIPSLSGAARDRFRGQHIGIVYQTLHMVDAISVIQNLMLAQYAAGLPPHKAKALKLLKRLGIAEQRNKKPHELSQGQQQRLGVARAAINSPALIIGDEPTSALDDESCNDVMRLLVETAREANASLLIATHDARIKDYFAKQITLGTPV